MKNTILVSVLALALTACGGGGSDSPADPAQPSLMSLQYDLYLSVSPHKPPVDMGKVVAEWNARAPQLAAEGVDTYCYLDSPWEELLGGEAACKATFELLSNPLV